VSVSERRRGGAPFALETVGGRLEMQRISEGISLFRSSVVHAQIAPSRPPEVAARRLASLLVGSRQSHQTIGFSLTGLSGRCRRRPFTPNRCPPGEFASGGLYAERKVSNRLAWITVRGTDHSLSFASLSHHRLSQPSSGCAHQIRGSRISTCTRVPRGLLSGWLRGTVERVL